MMDVDVRPNLLAWSFKDRSPLLEVFANDKVIYGGQHSEAEREVAAIRTSLPIPSAEGIFYFEVSIINAGRPGLISIGLANTATPSYSSLPGKDRHSWGFRGDDGHFYEVDGTNYAYGAPYSTGDVIGCCYNSLDHSMFYTCNGVTLGDIRLDMPSTQLETLYPLLAICSNGAVTETNFGAQPFKFQIDTFKATIRARLHEDIVRRELSPQAVSSLPKLVADYLYHRGYTEALGKLSAATGITIHANVQLSQARRDIQRHIARGEAAVAKELLQERFPITWARHPDLRLDLECQEFVELVSRYADDMDAHLEELMQRGRQLQLCIEDEAFHGDGPRQQRIATLITLLAYPNVKESPAAPLLETAPREQLASRANALILEDLKQPKYSVLERITNHSEASVACLRDKGVGCANFLELDTFVTARGSQQELHGLCGLQMLKKKIHNCVACSRPQPGGGQANGLGGTLCYTSHHLRISNQGGIVQALVMGVKGICQEERRENAAPKGGLDSQSNGGQMLHGIARRCCRKGQQEREHCELQQAGDEGQRATALALNQALRKLR
ncbi:uncharacterized protein MONBRDRAFT_31450 [Monosiga brevicollis MX1]|uniref:B30.2/SPRY domain-containing protein n=1 Tax=Monosiga brevicollis TaxID=81824 RepID=A9UT84_MONBE|nr:uncharacterized protein MONBRDRAFT_31450 [Monosiga brevicollis MX1]EDQ91449.1 predicted protein [Monosiga brevicollis MX1]|eukprot:XP_001743871.1 hypothetical protein [Monosiga brevicollis MX1]